MPTLSVVPAIPTFQGGQMTDLPPFPRGVFNGTELLEIVANETDTPTDEAQALNYQITTALLASLMIGIMQGPVFVNDGEHTTPGDPFIVPVTAGRVYVNKTVPEPTFIQFGAVDTYFFDVIVADVAGTAEFQPSANFITVTFNGAEEASGQTQITIENPYGGWAFRPVVDADTALAMWLLGAA